MTAPVVLVHASDVDARRGLARALEAHGIEVLLSSRAAEAAKCLAAGNVRVAVVWHDADVLTTVRARQPLARAIWVGERRDKSIDHGVHRMPADAAIEAIVERVRGELDALTRLP